MRFYVIDGLYRLQVAHKKRKVFKFTPEIINFLSWLIYNQGRFNINGFGCTCVFAPLQTFISRAMTGCTPVNHVSAQQCLKQAELSYTTGKNKSSQGRRYYPFL